MALNADRLPATAEGKFFRDLMRQWPQGLWVVAPDGKVLGFHYHKPLPGEKYGDGQARWTRETLQMIRDALKATGPLAAREIRIKPEPFPERGAGASTDGGARLSVSVVRIQNGRHDGPPVVDSIFLNADQWASFLIPKVTKVKGEWAIPDESGDRFAPAMSPMTDSIFSPRPEDVKKAKITATLERSGDGLAVIRYKGSWETFHYREGDTKFPIRSIAVGEGVGVQDLKSGKMRAMAWLISGNYRNSPPNDAPQKIVAVVDWTAKE